MKLFRRLWGRFCDWWAGRRRFRSSHVVELPDVLRPCFVYVEGEDGEAWVAAFLCPCGCSEVIQLNLLPEQRPRWALTEHDDATVTLHPSVNRRVGCRSHFFLRAGLVDWCS